MAAGAQQVVETLEAGATVADVGCGYGHSTGLMAEAFPASRFHGFDTHSASIAEAKRIAAEAGAGGRLPRRRYDLICFSDCLHDMGDPVAALAHAAKALAPDGTVLLVEPFANDRVEDNVSPVARLYYTVSTTLCCAYAISEGGRLVLDWAPRPAGRGWRNCSARPASPASIGRRKRRST